MSKIIEEQSSVLVIFSFARRMNPKPINININYTSHHITPTEEVQLHLDPANNFVNMMFKG
jgi:hypothetical protein